MRLGSYELVRRLSSGPDGAAYEARQGGTGDPLELRDLSEIREVPGRWEQLRSRVTLLRKINEPALRPLIDADLEGPRPFLVLPAARLCLADHLREDGALSPPKAKDMIARFASLLVFAHRLGLTHGAISPARVSFDPETGYCLELTGTNAGDPAALGALDRSCASPEAGPEGPVSPLADIYALGALWCCALTGLPAPGPGGGEDTNVDADPPRPQAEGVGECEEDELRRRMCSRDPDARPSAWEVAVALRALGDAGGAAAKTTGDETSSQGMRGSAPVPKTLGRYELGEVLGRGGMGVVYRARDLGGGEPVALKVLHGDLAGETQMLHRFRREARLLSQLDNPFIARFVELNEDAGFVYLVMELAEGRSLLDILRERKRLGEDEALAIAADVARALADVHALGVVHRDVKPENIILQSTDEAGAHRVVLCDFGIARRADDESVAITRTGAAVGTPAYMSPEQCEGKDVDARTDVYALGATLFGMLAGRPPFRGDGPGAVMAKQIRDPAPDLATLQPEIRPAIASLVARTLEKAPDARPADGGELLEAIERVRRGGVERIHAHPHKPDTPDGERIVPYPLELDLDATPEDLWPLIADTDRVNRAAGLEAIDWKRVAGDEGVETYGHMEAIGMQIRWREHPHEWIAPERFGVLREYSEGPFRWLRSTVELRRREGGGTSLRHVLEIAPRGVIGRTAARVEIGFRVRRAFARVYRRIDWFLAMRTRRERGPSGLLPDPFEDPGRLSAAARERLAKVHARLGEHGIDQAVADRLCAHLEHKPAQAVARLRPRVFARDHGFDEGEVIDACLVAAYEGALVLRWDVLCPSCRIASTVVDTLAELRQHGDCEACNIRFELDLSRSVEMVFAAHPQIREVEAGIYCIGGPGHFPHVVAQVRLAPGERFDADLRLEEGLYRVTGRELPSAWPFRVTSSALLSSWEVELRPGLTPQVPRALGLGSQRLVLTNELGVEVAVRIERMVARDDAVTAAAAASLPLFRRLFAGEVLAPGRLVSVSKVVLLLAQPDDVEALYEHPNEMDAYAVLAGLHQEVDDCARAEGGTVVKIHGDGILASFVDPVAAFRAARALADDRTDLRVAVHAGAAVATTMNDRLDYFGRTVRRVGAIAAAAGGPGLILGEEIASDPAVRGLLGPTAKEASAFSSAGILAQRFTSASGERGVERAPLGAPTQLS